MPEVHIDQLELENFGPYYGNHLFNFGSLEGRYATLIGGKNGAGKTHLLRALYLAAVGEAGRGDLKRLETESEATKFSMEQSLNRRARREGKGISKLGITLSLKDGHSTARKLVLTREIRHRPNSSIEFKSFANFSDEERREEDPERIQKIRDSFLPRHLARFFFFDAERSQNLQLNQEDIIQGISKVLGLWNYEELETDLNHLISSKIPSQFGRGSDIEQKLADITADIERFDRKCKALIQERQEQEIQASTTESEFEAVEEELQNLGAVDPKQLEEAREKYNQANQVKSQLETTLRSAWETALPIGLLGAFRDQLSVDLAKEERLRDWNNRKSSVEPKIPQIKSDVFGEVPMEHRLSDDLKAYYLKRLDDALHRLFNPTPEGMADKIYLTPRTEISVQVRTLLRSPTKQISQLVETCSELDRSIGQAKELEQRLRQFQQNQDSTDRANELREQRGRLGVRRETTERRLRDIETELAGFESQKAEAQREQSNLGESVAKLQRGRSLTVVANRYRQAVSEIRQRAAVQMRERIAELVGTLWVDIADRTLEYRRMEFDKHWQCFLIKQNGDRVSWDSVNTSAGQRQVRSLCFVESLRRLAKLAPPLVVDTPLGRLDKEVRQNVLERLYVSGHQCIILSTDSEIDPEGLLFRRVSPKIARVYTLHPQGRKESEDYEVRVSDDYFGHSL